jgi:hypothetical protein
MYDLHEIWCAECNGFVGYATSTQPLPSIVHGSCGERMKQDAERPDRECGLEVATDQPDSETE